MPGTNDVHVSSALSDFATAYKNSGFIADDICPILTVQKEADTFFTRNRKDVSTKLDDRLGSRSQANEASYDVSTDTYIVEGRGLKDVVSASLVQNADDPLDPHELATANVMQRLMLAREIRVADLVMSSGNWASGNTAAVSNYWSDEVNGTPLDDFHTALEAIPSTGEDSRLIGVCSLPVFHSLQKHPQLLGLRAGGGSASGALGRQELASFLELDDLFVSRTFKNTANTGQNASYSRVWDATAFAIVQRPRGSVQGTEQSMFCATFRVAPGLQVRTWHDPATGRGGSDWVQVEFADDEKVVQNDAGYLMTGVLA